MARRVTHVVLLLPMVGPGCGGAERTEARVTFQADNATRAQTVSVRVRVCDQDGGLDFDQTVILAGASMNVEWPFALDLVPRDDDPARVFFLVAQTLNVRGETLQTRILRGTYEADQRVDYEVQMGSPNVCSPVPCLGSTSGIPAACIP